MLKNFGDLGFPFVLELRDAQERSAHECDDEGCDQREDTFVYILCRLERIAAYGVEGSYYACTNNEADEDTKGDTEPYL